MFAIYGPKKKNKLVEKVVDFPTEGSLIALTEEANKRMEMLNESNQDEIIKFLEEVSRELDELDLMPDF